MGGLSKKQNQLGILLYWKKEYVENSFCWKNVKYDDFGTHVQDTGKKVYTSLLDTAAAPSVSKEVFALDTAASFVKDVGSLLTVDSEEVFCGEWIGANVTGESWGNTTEVANASDSATGSNATFSMAAGNTESAQTPALLENMVTFDLGKVSEALVGKFRGAYVTKDRDGKVTGTKKYLVVGLCWRHSATAKPVYIGDLEVKEKAYVAGANATDPGHTDLTLRDVFV